VRSELGRLPLTRRIEQLRGEAERVAVRGVDLVLGALQIASKQDLDRIDRKLGQVSRKLREMERSRGNGRSASA
jgi:hypothetical protein